MKKIVLASTGIVFIAMVAVPKLVGNSIEQKLLSVTDTINQNPVYKASIENLQSDWFSTSAIIQVGFEPTGMGNAGDPDVEKMFANMNLDILFSAQHGPVLTSDGFALGLVNWNAKALGESLRDKIEFDIDTPIYRITSQTSLFGSSTFSDEIPSFTLKDDEAFTHVSFSGWKGDGKASNQHTSYQGKTDTIDIKSAFGDLQVNQWSFDLDMDLGLLDALDGSFYDSTLFMQINNIIFENAGTEESTKLDDLKIDGVSVFDKANDLLDTNMNITLSRFENATFNLTELLVNTEMNNLQEAFFKAYQRFMNTLSAEPEKMQQNLNTFIQGSGLAQLQACPELNISAIKGKLNEGNFSGSFNSKIHNVTELPANIADMSFWLTHVLADVQLSVDKNVAVLVASNMLKAQLANDPNMAQMSDQEMTDIVGQQSAAILQNFQQQGMLTETDNEYQLAASLKDGQALLNGNPMPLPVGN